MCVEELADDLQILDVVDPAHDDRHVFDPDVIALEHRLDAGIGFAVEPFLELIGVHNTFTGFMEAHTYGVRVLHPHATNLVLELGSLAVHFDRVEQPDIAATLYGASTRARSLRVLLDLPDTVEHLRAVLDPAVFDERVATGAAMDLGDAVVYARQQIRLARQSAEGLM